MSDSRRRLAPAKSGKRIGKVTKAQQRVDTTRKLLAAALRLFVERGYRATTLETIAREAGLTKGAVYFHFRNKEAILCELLKQAESTVIDPALALVASSDRSAVETLIRFFHHQSRASLTHTADILLLILMALEFMNETGDAATRVKAIWSKLQNCFQELIRKGRRSGDIRSDLPERELAAVLLALHNGTFLEWYRHPKQLNGPDLARTVSTFVAIGLGGDHLTATPGTASALPGSVNKTRAEA